MNRQEIAKTLKLTAQLMEVHNENPFKVKSLANAAYRLAKSGIDIEQMSLEELEKVEGIGKSIAQKINELQVSNELKELKQMLSITPSGVVDMLEIKGIGPKKVAQLWKELEVESVGELLYACHENRLVDLKGFGSKTQDQVKKAIEFSMINAGKFLYAHMEEKGLGLVEWLKKKYATDLVSLTGEVRRKSEVLEKLEVLVASSDTLLPELEEQFPFPVDITICKPEEFSAKLFETTGSKQHLSMLTEAGYLTDKSAFQQATSEEAIYRSMGLAFIPPELREGLQEINWAKENEIPSLIKLSDLKGILHNHSTYSDGFNSLREMAEYAKQLGYEYLGICDHSQSAFYANGLKPSRVIEQQNEIDQLNKELAPFKIFKGIESDILNDGSLDYTEEMLKSFDFIVASVHSNLKMDKEKATSRLLKAIENPYTTILGHPTGRLLLSRAGYPIDHKKIIDACAAHHVAIELNANPYRLDIDWRWIQYCIEKGVPVSINPDAHHKQGYLDMHYGVCVARKGGLTKETCFNALSRDEIGTYFNNRRDKN